MIAIRHHPYNSGVIKQKKKGKDGRKKHPVNPHSDKMKTTPAGRPIRGVVCVVCAAVCSPFCTNNSVGEKKRKEK
jgi:hypothetical protein